MLARFKTVEMLWDILLMAALSYVFYCIFDTADKVRSTNAYVKSLDESLVRWMADPRDTPSLPNS